MKPMERRPASGYPTSDEVLRKRRRCVQGAAKAFLLRRELSDVATRLAVATYRRCHIERTQSKITVWFFGRLLDRANSTNVHVRDTDIFGNVPVDGRKSTLASWRRAALRSSSPLLSDRMLGQTSSRDFGSGFTARRSSRSDGTVPAALRSSTLTRETGSGRYAPGRRQCRLNNLSSQHLRHHRYQTGR
jgi:hypothetical protein